MVFSECGPGAVTGKPSGMWTALSSRSFGAFLRKRRFLCRHQSVAATDVTFTKQQPGGAFKPARRKRRILMLFSPSLISQRFKPQKCPKKTAHFLMAASGVWSPGPLSTTMLNNTTTLGIKPRFHPALRFSSVRYGTLGNSQLFPRHHREATHSIPVVKSPKTA